MSPLDVQCGFRFPTALHAIADHTIRSAAGGVVDDVEVNGGQAINAIEYRDILWQGVRTVGIDDDNCLPGAIESGIDDRVEAVGVTDVRRIVSAA